MNNLNCLFDESKSVGVDYSDKNVVEEYDQKHEKFRNFDEEASRISESIGLSKESVILDMGCGTGGLATRLAVICGRVYAVDSSEAMINLVKSKIEKQNITNIDLIQAGFLTYNHAGEKLDAVIANISLHHLPDFWKQIALNRINAILKPGGKFFLCDLVFAFDPEEYEKEVNDWIKEMRKTAGEQMANETVLHVKEEFSTWNWIITGMLEKANFRIDSNSEIMKNLRVYVCTKNW